MILYQTAKWICSQEMIDIISYHDQVFQFYLNIFSIVLIIVIKRGYLPNSPRTAKLDDFLCTPSMDLLNLMYNFSHGNFSIVVSNLKSLLDFGSICAPQISLPYSKMGFNV